MPNDLRMQENRLGQWGFLAVGRECFEGHIGEPEAEFRFEFGVRADGKVPFKYQRLGAKRGELDPSHRVFLGAACQRNEHADGGDRRTDAESCIHCDSPEIRSG